MTETDLPALQRAVNRMFSNLAEVRATLGLRVDGGGMLRPPRDDPDRVPFVLSRGAVAMSRAEFDALGPDALARINSVHAWSGTRPDVTVVEPDGTLTEIEGGGP